MSRIQRIFACFVATVALLAINQPTYAQREPGRQDQRGTIKTIDANSITVAFGGGRETPATEKTFAIAKNVEVAIGGGGFRLGGLYKEAKLADLSEGTIVSLSLSADQKSVESILADEPMVRGILKSVHAKKNTIVVTSFAGREEAGEAKMYQFTDDADIAIDDGRGRRASIKEGKIDDLAEGAIVTLRLTLDKKRVTGVLAEGSTFFGVVKSIDADKRMMILTVPAGRGDDAREERTLAIAKEAVIVIDDGKGRLLSVKAGKLADIPVGSSVNGKLAVDQSFVMALKAEGPILFGMLKGVDAVKNTITIAIPKGRDDAEEKTLTVAKDARVNFDGKTTTLGDLKIGENGPLIQLRLTLNQQAVQTVNAHEPRPRE